MGHAEFVTISDPFSSITRCEGMALSLIPLTSQMELDILGNRTVVVSTFVESMIVS